MNTSFLNKVLIIVTIALAVLLGLSMGGVLPYVSHVSVSPVFFTITSTSYITSYSTITTVSPLTTTVAKTTTATVTSTVTQVSTTTTTVTQTITQVSTVTVTSTTTTASSPITTTTPTIPTSTLLFNTTLSSPTQYTAFIINNSLYIYYAVGNRLNGIRIINNTIVKAPALSLPAGAPSYYNNGLLLITPVNNSLALAYWGFNGTLRLLTRPVGYYYAYAYNPSTSLTGALWWPSLLTYNESRLIIFRNWRQIANVSMPSANTIIECPNSTFIIQLLNSTYVTYPGFRDYNGFQSFGCNYYMAGGVLYYDGFRVSLFNAFYAYPNGSLIIAYTQSGVELVGLNGNVLYRLDIGMPAKALVFRFNGYYYLIISTTGGELLVYKLS